MLLGASYWYVTSGGLVARQTPHRLEANAARWLLALSVPARERERTNPIARTDASVTAGRVLYQQKCDVCHGYDGSGRTETGGGQYPPALDLRGPEVAAATDG